MTFLFASMILAGPAFALDAEPSALDDDHLLEWLDASLPHDPALPVVGGAQVQGNRWDATVGIVVGGSYVNCTGTLIHPKVVLTAGHCLGGVSHVLVGSKDWLEDDPKAELIEVLSSHPHPDYTGYGADIALLKLAKRSNRRPATIALECILDRYLEKGARAEVVGFGVSRPDGNGFNSLLNHGTTRVQMPGCAKDTYEGLVSSCDPDQRPRGELTAGGGGISVCYGDSGGPLFLRTDEGDFVAGVASRLYLGTPANEICLHGAVYTRPDAFFKWLEREANVELDVYPCNEAPVARANEILTRPGKTGFSTVVVDDPDGVRSDLVYELVERPEHGTVKLRENGDVAYTADDGFTGRDRFTVSITDAGNPDYPLTGDPITVDVDIPVEVRRGLFMPSGAEGLVACSSAGGSASAWLALIALAAARRRS